MKIDHYQVSEELRDIITEMVYIKDFYPEHEVDKYLPDGTTSLIFELKGKPKYTYENGTKRKKKKYEDVWYSGIHTKYITISSENEEMIVLGFKPGISFLITGKPAHILKDRVVHANEVFGDSILQLHRSLIIPSTSQYKFQLIVEWLSERLTKDEFYIGIINYAIQEIGESNGQISIKAIAKKVGYSQKQFIHIFKKYVGVTPKQFHRIKRFNEILHVVNAQQKISWSRIAYECGYFDQAHFIRDFKSFSGLNPKAYIYDIGDYPNYFPVK